MDDASLKRSGTKGESFTGFAKSRHRLKEVPTAPAQWPTRIIQLKVNSPNFAKQNTALLQRATNMRNKAIAPVTEELRKDGDIKKLLAKMEESIKAVSDYEGTIDNHRKKLEEEINKLG